MFGHLLYATDLLECLRPKFVQLPTLNRTELVGFTETFLRLKKLFLCQSKFSRLPNMAFIITYFLKASFPPCLTCPSSSFDTSHTGFSRIVLRSGVRKIMSYTVTCLGVDNRAPNFGKSSWRLQWGPLSFVNPTVISQRTFNAHALITSDLRPSSTLCHPKRYISL